MYVFTKFKSINFGLCLQLFNVLSSDATYDSTSTWDYDGISTCKSQCCVVTSGYAAIHAKA